MAGSRGGNGEGSYYYDEHRKRWIWRRRIVDADGTHRRITLTASKRADLIKKVRQYQDNYELTNGLSGNQRITVAQWVNKWEQSTALALKPKTIEYYHRFCENYIIPGLGKTKIVDLSMIIIQDFLNVTSKTPGKSGKMLSNSSINGIRITLTACLEAAVRAGLLSRNPAKQTKRMRNNKRAIVVLTAEQLSNFLQIAEKGAYLKDTPYLLSHWTQAHDYLAQCFATAIILAAETGMRYGEVYGLQWDDVNLDDGSIFVRHNLSESGSSIVIDTPKTANSIRKISLTRRCIAKLTYWQDYQATYANDVGDYYHNKDMLVFATSVGSAIRVSNFRRSCWSKLCAAADIPDGFTFHSLRHTHAILLLQAGVNPKVVSERLGHASVQITLDVYAHVLPDMQRTAVEAIEKTIK